VRITASEVIGVEVVPSMLAALREKHPGLVIELGLSNRSEDLLGREADIAVRNFRPVQDALVARHIGAIGLGLHAHRRYLDRHGTPASIQALGNFALVGFEHATIGVRALQAMGLTLQREDFAFRTDSDLGQLAAIRAGIGIGICQVGIARRDPDLVHLLPDAFAFPLDTWVVTHEDLRHVQRVRLVYDALVEGLIAYAGA
jgi:DNA-binding transcriptional LysR family regulator